MERKIHLLSNETINQIAAGEVIESPASVIKELVENSLDAEAKKITVDVAGGGLKKIRITDDGIGMGPEDARSSILRYATSKLVHAVDLFKISSKGFRGEALSSIASISKMTIQTALDDMSGVELDIENGEVIKEKPFARTRGTTIEVRSLFYNVPARKKFQKSAAAISAEIFRTMTILALSHPNVHFELISNNRSSIKTFDLDLYARAEELLGEEFTKGSFPLEFEEGPLHFTGLIGSPSNTRVNKIGQFLFLNQRGVACDPIAEAVRAGYGTRIEERRHPIFLLHLNVPPDLVDVNVHPQKLHVRLRKEDLFREKVSEAVSLVLGQKKISSTEISTPFTSVPIHFAEIPLRMQEEIEVSELSFDQDFTEAMGQAGRFLFFHDGQAKELILVDSEAASFRALFEHLKGKTEGKVESQGLLVPFTITLTTLESAMVLTHLDAIEKMGFSMKAIGKNAFMIEAFPSFLEEGQVQSVISAMAEGLQEFIGGRNYKKERQEKLALIAALYAKRKKRYHTHEAALLLKQLMLCQTPYHCPSGEPTIMRMSYDEIEHFFRENQKNTARAQS